MIKKRMYRMGYFKALLDVMNLLIRQEQSLKTYKINNVKHIIKLMQYCIDNVEDMIQLGDKIDVCYLCSKEQKGKKEIETWRFVRPDSPEAKKYNEFIKNELLRPYSLASVQREKRTLYALYGRCYWCKLFYDEFKDKPLEENAQKYFDIVCEKHLKKGEKQ